MRRIAITTTFMVLMLIGLGSSAANAQVSFGLRIGPPPVARVVRVLPPRPAPGYVWVAGYWYPAGGHYAWRNGYWARRPYASAVWVGPRYVGQRYYAGYWSGGRSRFRVSVRGRY
jgi:hypothetical protein